ncbi:DUF2793 domain-containing protein [Sphingomonas qilianensis]|uniref:DUF2793 domain-containing protein n=1 Tax=Sphingomonas qilianensis TaxID=1736690 RepID=A0ABU9XRM9_9SPHN
MSDTTSRLGLPMIRVGQAQKELSHNEALALIDLLIHAAVIGFAVNAPPPTPAPGDTWVVGSAPSGAWAGRANQLAGWTDGGWRFAVPIEGMAVWIVQGGVLARFAGGVWNAGDVTASRLMIGGNMVVGPQQAAIAAPTGGTVTDGQARVAIASILQAMRTHGLIAG